MGDEHRPHHGPILTHAQEHAPAGDESVSMAIRSAIESRIRDAQVQVQGAGGHFSITVISPEFAHQTMVEAHRLVYGAIAGLMTGPGAPVHAVDTLKTSAHAPRAGESPR